MFDKSVIYKYPEYKYLYNSLTSSRELEALLDEKKSRFDPNTLVNGSNLNRLDIGLSYIAYKLKNERSILDMNRIKLLRDVLFNRFKQNNFFASELIVFSSGIRELLFDSNQLVEINAYFDRRSKKASKSFSEFENGAITENDFEHLLVIAQTWLNSPTNSKRENICDKLYERILNKTSNLSLVEIEFVAKYTAYLNAKDLEMPVHPVCLSDYRASTNSVMDYNLGGYSQEGTGIIHINKKRAYNNEVLQMFPDMKIDYCTDLIETVSHENRHTSQDYRSRNKGYLDEYAFDFAVYSIISQYYPNEYNRNYSSQRIEMDAELYGWNFTRSTLEKYAPTKVADIEESVDHNYQKRIDKSLAFKKSEEGKKSQLDSHDLILLDELVLKYPDVLRYYPVLSYYYELNGKRKDFFDTSVNLDGYSYSDWASFNRIKLRFLKIDIFKNRYLANIDIEALPLQHKRDLYLAILDILENNKGEIISSMIGLQRNDKKISVFTGLNSIRIKESLRLWDYIKEHKEDMARTNDICKSKGIILLYFIDWKFFINIMCH